MEKKIPYLFYAVSITVSLLLINSVQATEHKKSIAYHMETEPEIVVQEPSGIVETAAPSREVEQALEAERARTREIQNKIEQPVKKTIQAQNSMGNGTKNTSQHDIDHAVVDSAPKAAYVRSSVIPEFNEKEYIDERRVAVKDLVDKGVSLLQTRTENEALHAFTYDPNYIIGEIYLFVFTLKGTCLANGDDPAMVWQNMYDFKDIYGNFVIRAIIEKAQQGGGWMTYQWRNATKISYVRLIERNGRTYVVGAGYYPHSKRDATVGLVRSASEYFKTRMKAGGTPDEAFSKFSYPLGSFVLGDLYLYALDFEGNIVAQGDRPGLIGQNSLEYRDADGKFANKEIIEKLKNTTGGVWIEYKSKRARKVTYAEKVTDEKGKHYFIACGYYPDADRKEAVDLVRQCYKYMQGQGKTQAADEVNSKTSNAFRYGDLAVAIHDMKGVCIANGNNTDYVGVNQYDLQDEEGKYYIQEMIKKAKDGGGWLDFRLKNTFFFVYVEKVRLGIDEYVISSGLYPVSKPESMQLLVKGAVSLLASNPEEKAFGEIAKNGGPFARGDLEIFVFDDKGICYVHGNEPELIWRNMLNAKDQDGREYVRQFISTAKQGAGRVNYKERGRTRYAYVEPIEKNGTLFIVGSSFYK